MIAMLVAAAVQCAPRDGLPIPPQAARAWQSLLEYSLQQYEDNVVKYNDMAVRLRTRRSHRTTALLTANSVNAVDIASAAINASVDGADAGVTVAPFLLAGDATPGQLKLTLAALKDGKSRGGVAFTHDWVPEFDTYGSLRLAPCPMKKDDFEKELSTRQCAFERSCAVIARLPDPGHGKGHEEWLRARFLCGLESPALLEKEGVAPAKQRVDIAGLLLDNATREVARAFAPGDARAAEIRGLRERATQDFTEASRIVPDKLDACNAKRIGDAYVARTWEAGKTSVGVQYAADFFTAVFGSSDVQATHGQVARHDARVEADYSKGPLNLTVGIGYGSERSAPGKPFQRLLRPSAEVSLVVAAIGSESLWTGPGAVNVKDGAVVPHITVGLSLTEENKDDFSALTQADITPYVAFTFSEKLLVRAGIPLQVRRTCTADALAASKAAGEDACDAISGSRPTEIRWTVPASIVTILKV